MTMNQIENLPCQVVMSGKGFATVSFTLPEEHINGFVALLSSLANLFRGLGWKVKTNIEAIHLREDARAPGRQERVLQFENYTAETFLDYLKQGNSPRESLSLTASHVHHTYSFSSYDIVKTCLTKRKLLKKSGFYKSRHKFFLDDEKI